GRWTEIALFTRIKNHVRIHEQRLIPLREIDPEIISIGLRGVVPHAEVTVIGIVDVHFASGTALAAGIDRGDPGGWGDPIRIAVHDRCVIVIRHHAVADWMRHWLPGFVGTNEADQMAVPPFRAWRSFLGDNP